MSRSRTETLLAYRISTPDGAIVSESLHDERPLSHTARHIRIGPGPDGRGPVVSFLAVKPSSPPGTLPDGCNCAVAPDLMGLVVRWRVDCDTDFVNEFDHNDFHVWLHFQPRPLESVDCEYGPAPAIQSL